MFIGLGHGYTTVMTDRLLPPPSAFMKVTKVEFHSRPSDGDVMAVPKAGWDCKALFEEKAMSPVSMHDHKARVSRMSLIWLPEPLYQFKFSENTVSICILFT